MQDMQLHDRTAGYVEYLPGDIARDVRRQEDDGVGDIRGGTHPPQGKRAEHRLPPFFHLLGRELGHIFPKNSAEVGRGRPGGDAIHPDTCFAFHEGKLSGEKVDGVLGHSIRPDSHAVLMGAARADIDDYAVLLLPHLGDNGLANIQGADEVQLQLLFPYGRVLLFNGNAIHLEDAAGDVAEDIDSAVFGKDSLDHLLYLAVVGDICFDSDALAAEVLHCRSGLFYVLQVDVGYRNGTAAFSRQKQGCSFPESYLAAGPGN